ncbi:MAG: patatin-like phospholipase family protein [Vicinamibacterales bacterium]
MMAMTKDQHLDEAREPKRILSLDGGGIRGVLTLEYLDAIERMLRERSGQPNLVLADYFDLIGGTSTGAIIAASLACGMKVGELKTLYRDLGESVFEPSYFQQWQLGQKLAGVISPKFPGHRVQQALDKCLGATTTLDSPLVRTGLMIMTKRLDTGSPWPLHNHPRARYSAQDGQLLLTQVVRASTAAPTYFEPQEISISSRNGSVTTAAFVDGGVSPFNDPALQLLMLAALDGHGFRWKTGKDRLLLISVGTGTYRETFTAEALLKMKAAEQGLRSLKSLMDDTGRVNHALLQWLTNCVTPWTIDRAVGDMRTDSKNGPQLATYARYNVLLDQKWLAGLSTEITVEYLPERLTKIAEMDDATNMDELAEIGRLAAKIQIDPAHFPQEFDLRDDPAAADA